MCSRNGSILFWRSWQKCPRERLPLIARSHALQAIRVMQDKSAGCLDERGRFGQFSCHRIVHADGRLVEGWQEQRALLEEEGVRFRLTDRVDMASLRGRKETDENKTSHASGSAGYSGIN